MSLLLLILHHQPLPATDKMFLVFSPAFFFLLRAVHFRSCAFFYSIITCLPKKKILDLPLLLAATLVEKEEKKKKPKLRKRKQAKKQEKTQKKAKKKSLD